jgi:hypothetical protein
MLNFDFWDREWPVITAAPHIVLWGTVIIIAVVFFVVRWGYSREVAGRKAETAVLNERLRLAADEQTAVTRELDRLKQNFAKLDQQIERGMPVAGLASATATVSGTIGDLSRANSLLGSTLAISGPRGRVVIEPKIRSSRPKRP